jgi:dTDP-4-amino-4,6-dideoxygalactose transaminase
MTVLMNDFKAEPAELKRAERDALSRVLESGCYVLGKEVEAFEREWADACSVGHAIGTGNALDAIEIGLRALDIGHGQEVVTTTMTAFATALAIMRAGATPVLADIDPETGLLDASSVQRCLSSRTRAVLLVHLYGRMADVGAWRELAENAGILLLEDCAQSHLARVDGGCAGTFGAFGAYSFYPTKNLGTPGDGGALITSDNVVATRARQLRNYGRSDPYHHPELGMNSRLDELHAAVLRVRLPWVQSFTTRRRQIADAYWAGIANPQVRLLRRPDVPDTHVHHLFVLTSPERDRLAAFLDARGIQTLMHYPIPVHRQPPSAHLPRDPEGLRHAEQHAATCLSLPCHPQLRDEDVARVIEAVNRFS